jgi:hypothetical protein
MMLDFGSVNIASKKGRYVFATMPNSRINALESWFIINLQKININQNCNSIRGYGIIMIHTDNILQELMAISIIRAEYI